MKNTSFRAKFAGIPVEINCISPEIRSFCAEYITDEPCVFSVSVTADDIYAEASAAASYGHPDTPDLLNEIAALHRKISEVFPLYGRLLMHGAAITYKGAAYMFCAPSGTGKSTHISLWRKFLGQDVGIINGDKPFLSFEESSGHNHIRVCGSPWAGKENWQNNRSAPLRAICLISRSSENIISHASPDKCLPALMRQIYIPRSTEAAHKALEITDRLVRTVPVYQLACDISENAVKCSFEALTGLSYPPQGNS